MKLKLIGNPREIRTPQEAEFYLDGIKKYELDNGLVGGILMTQRTYAPPLYEITSAEQATRELESPVLNNTPEFGIKFYTKKYFEALIERLRGNEEVELPEPKRRR